MEDHHADAPRDLPSVAGIVGRLRAVAYEMETDDDLFWTHVRGAPARFRDLQAAPTSFGTARLGARRRLLEQQLLVDLEVRP